MPSKPKMRLDPDRDEKAFETTSSRLVAEFRRWLPAGSPGVDPEDATLLLDWKFSYADGRLDRWSADDLEEFLLSWCPRKVSFPLELARTIPGTVAAFLEFLADRGWLAPDTDPGLPAYARAREADFMAAMRDPAKFGMAKSLFAGLDLGPDDLEDPAAVQAAIESFNALAEEERFRLTRGEPGSPEPEDDSPIGPVVRPDPQVLRRSAESAPVLTGFRRLSDYFAPPGRVLTKTGNLKLADARELVERLETGERFEQQYGEVTFHTRTAAHLWVLDHWQWWARAAGVLRKRHDRLIAVKSWPPRARKDPAAEVRRIFEVLLDHGVLSSALPQFQTRMNDFLDAAVLPILFRLVSADTDDFADLVEVLTSTSAELGIAELYPGQLERSLETLVVVLERAGVLRHENYQMKPDLIGDERRTGGTLALTPIGVSITIDLAREAGVPIDVIERLDELPGTALVKRMEGLGPEEWWPLAGRWLAEQPARSQALDDLIDALADDPLLFLMVLGGVPDDQRDAWAAALRRRTVSDPPPGEIGSIALQWLLSVGLVDPTDVDPQTALDATLVTMGLMAEYAAEQFGESVAEMAAESAYEIIAAVIQREPPRAEKVLQTLGSRHPDKAVAKTARRELFRLRSRLASRAVSPEPG